MQSKWCFLETFSEFFGVMIGIPNNFSIDKFPKIPMNAFAGEVLFIFEYN